MQTIIESPDPSNECPTTPKRASIKGHYPRHSKTFISPVNLPIRTADNYDTNSGNSVDKKQLHHSPHETSPLKISPRRSFYLEKAVPIEGEELTSITPIPEMDNDLNKDLIFDDGDERLPPPEASPTHRYKPEADVIAVSSLNMSPGTIANINELGLTEGVDFNLPHNSGHVDKCDSRFGSPLSSQRLSSLDIHMAKSPQSPAEYYPTPIPSQLMRPPRLSAKHKRTKSPGSIDNFPPPPQWGKSPLEETVQYKYGAYTPTPTLSQNLPFFTYDDGEDNHHVEPNDLYSDVDSDRATVMSNDGDEFEAYMEPPGSGKNENDTNVKNRGWLSKLFSKKKQQNFGQKKDEMGEEYDVKEAEVLQEQMGAVDMELAFARLDPETIQRHSQMFNVGGLHSSTVPHSGEPTSLIEELEIRKAGKRVQKQVFSREIIEIERQRNEDALTNQNPHPSDIVQNVQPTLMQMQEMAAVDYQARVHWHTRAINHHYIQDNSGETLAQRRARIKAEKDASKKLPQERETLAQRRERLKREKSPGSIRSHTNSTISSLS